MKKSPKKYYGFTLVELIIVITILAILSTIAFVSFQGYTKSSRDSVRLSNLSNIEKSLEVFNVKSGTYPTPDNKINISLSGSDVSYQGTLGDKSSSILGFSKTPTDPLDNSNYFYSTNTSGKSYSLISFTENQTSFISTKALADNSNKSTLTKGNLSYLLDANNNALTSNTDLFGNGSGSSFVQVLNNTTKLTGSGIELGGGFQMLALGNGSYSAPTTCPEGFIPVVGSADFSQPGFCVAKYEMKQTIGDAGSWNGSLGGPGPIGTSNNPYCTNISNCNNTSGISTINTKGGIISKADGYPIAWINQYNSIEACKNMGDGYHLITNNERMTIANQIENNSKNWSGGIIGSSLAIGQSQANWLDGGTGTLKAINGEYGYPNNGFISKRTNYLSNGEIIWDISGNIWEHVNKTNSIYGNNYDNGNTSLSGCPELINWSNYSDCSSVSKKIYPKNGNILSNGFGKIHRSSGGTNNIFTRGGNWAEGNNSGLYTITLSSTKNDAFAQLGFRCAYIKK